jgi:hypothetical protein
MSESLRALLAGIVDYAGLFPPARLPLDEAIRNYACYRQQADAWMLGRFIIPAARLGELDPFSDLFRSGPLLPLSVLGRGGNTIKEFLTNLSADLHDIAAFRQRHGAVAKVEVLEVRREADQADPLTPISTGVLLREVQLVAASHLALFFEPGPSIPPIVLVQQLERLRASGTTVGFKLRCGGLEASAFPSIEQVAQALHACLEAGVPFKATAGLHHPLRRFDSQVQATMHGFINLFTAGVLGHVHRLPDQTLCDILADDKAAHFTFDDAGLCWQDYRASVTAITEARRRAVLSFGSCSFDEPRDDLRTLGWL